MNGYWFAIDTSAPWTSHGLVDSRRPVLMLYARMGPLMHPFKRKTVDHSEKHASDQRIMINPRKPFAIHNKTIFDW